MCATTRSPRRRTKRGAQFVLTAHHHDDRIETFLIQWLRGAGPDGLAAFPAARAFADGTLLLLRPFIDVPRGAIERYVRRLSPIHRG